MLGCHPLCRSLWRGNGTQSVNFTDVCWQLWNSETWKHGFWARHWKDAVVWWMYTFCPFYSSFGIVLALILSFSIQSSLPHLHFHSQSQFLLLRHLILILHFWKRNPSIYPSDLFLLTSCSLSFTVPGLPTDSVPTVSTPASGLLPKCLGSAPSSTQHYLSGKL